MSEDTTVEPGSSGLLDQVSVEDSDKTETNPDASAIDHKEAGPVDHMAMTERPDWLPENFWKDSKPDLEGMAKSWKDLRAKISRGEHNAPADGNYKLDALGDGYDADNPIAGTLTSWAKENGLSQAQFDDLAGKLISQSRELMDQDTVDPKRELEALGPNGTAIVSGMVDWARGLVAKEIWTKEDFEEFKIMGGTARGLNVLLKLRSAYEGRVPIESAPMEGQMTKADLESMVADPRWNSDPNWRQQQEKKWFAANQ